MYSHLAARLFALTLLALAPGRAAAQPAEEAAENPPAPTAGGDIVPGRPGALAILDYARPPGIDGRSPFGYSAVLTPRQPLDGQPGRGLSLLRQDAATGFPLWIDGPNVVIGSLGVRNTQFDTDAVLPDSGRDFPDQLWDVRVGATYVRTLGDGWVAGAGVSVGSPSDRPFESTREVAPTATAFLRVPAWERDAWQFSLTYIPVSFVRFPLPGVAYEWNPSEELQVAVGLPFSVRWRPTDDLRFDLAYLPPQSVRAQWVWDVCPELSLFAGFEWVSDSYLLADRIDDREFLYSQEKRLPVGARLELGDHCVLDLGGGLAFDRIYFTARGPGERDRDRVEARPCGFVTARFAVRF